MRRPDNQFFSRLRPAMAGWLLLGAGVLWLLAGCRENPPAGVPTPFPTVTIAPTRTPSPTPAPTDTPAGITTHTIPHGNFSLRLPGDWAVVPAGLTPLGYYYQLGPEPVGPGPFSSSIFVTDPGAMTATTAAEQLLCGGGCAGAIDFEDTTVAGVPAIKTVLQAGDGPPLTWTFVFQDGRLLIFSIHDPDTLADRPDLLNTVEFNAGVLPAGENSATPTSSPTATLVPTIEPVRSWRRVAPPDAGLSFEVPAEWVGNQDIFFWSPVAELGLGVGFMWQAAGDESFPATDFFPAGAEERSSAPVVLPWGTAAVSYTLAVDNSLAGFVVVPAGEYTFAFSATAPNAETLATLQPVFSHILESVRLDFVVEPVIEEPVDAAIGFFQALINNEGEAAVLAFLTPRLREEIPDGETAISLLQLEDRLIEYNIDWEFITSASVLVTVTISLQNGAVVDRALTVVNLEEIGWRIDTISPVTE